MKVTVELNQQQEELLTRLIAEDEHGSTMEEVLRSVFLRFCSAHPELLWARAESETR